MKTKKKRDRSGEYARRVRQKETRQWKKGSPEEIKAEIAKYAAEDPKYAHIVEGILDTLRDRSNKTKDEYHFIR